MKNTPILRACGAALLSTAFLLALTPATRAADLIYIVTLNTASLVGNPDAPFSLDLDLVTGSNNGTHGNVTNTVTLSNFVFTGGTVQGTPNFTQGGESGSTASSVVLTNSALNNEFAIGFNTFPTQIAFKVDETTNSETVTSGTPIPDQFDVYLDDNNTASGFVPTINPDGDNSLLESVIFSGMTRSSVGTFNSTSPDAGVTVSTFAVSDLGYTALLFFGAVGLVFGAEALVAWRERARASQAA